MGSMIEAINQRVSVRNYISRTVEQEKLEIIREVMKSNTVGPFGNHVRFEIINLTEMDKKEMKEFGTYGFINRASLFMTGTVRETSHGLEDFGYCFEKIILVATSLGLGTCWLGGTFKRANFATRIQIADGEICPVASPLGYAQAKRSARDRLLRRIVKSDKRKPWHEIFFENDFNTPLNPGTTDRYNIPLECVRLAPSASNHQPWRIIHEKETGNFHLFLKRTRGYNITSRSIDLQLIDMGIAMCHFDLSASELGLEGKWMKLNLSVDVANMQYIASRVAA